MPIAELQEGRRYLALQTEKRRQAADLSVLRGSRNRIGQRMRYLTRRTREYGLTEAEDREEEELIMEFNRLRHLIALAERRYIEITRDINRLERGRGEQ